MANASVRVEVYWRFRLGEQTCSYIDGCRATAPGATLRRQQETVLGTSGENPRNLKDFNVRTVSGKPIDQKKVHKQVCVTSGNNNKN